MDCKDSASYIFGQPMCLEPFSKNAERGSLRSRDFPEAPVLRP